MFPYLEEASETVQSPQDAVHAPLALEKWIGLVLKRIAKSVGFPNGKALLVNLPPLFGRMHVWSQDMS